MKTFKSLIAILGLSFISLTSCQDEIDVNNSENPNTNSSTSATANKLERSAMYDGSFDDFLDGMSCSSILLPVTATINDTKVTLISQADYQLVLNILGRFTNDDDRIRFQFPLRVKMSNYNEVTVANQIEYDALMNACKKAEDQAQAAINCLEIEMPITILTYDLKAEQTGSVVIDSKQQLYTYMNNFDDKSLFAIKYPIKAIVKGEGSTKVEITSDLDFQSYISECTATEVEKDKAKQDAKKLETILVNGKFKVNSFIIAGANTANNYANYTIDFANDLTLTAKHTVNSTVQGTYAVASEVDVFLDIKFSGNAAFELLNESWKVKSYSQSSISLQSKTNAAITLVLSQI
ncbi:MAG: hypothetical protein ACOH2D_10950 [Gelidibacter sp.]|uniref:hypothetical protein n=1 Tax=Gelidibacter sp. TaxID=2018083 RepID=UPI003267EF87